MQKEEGKKRIVKLVPIVTENKNNKQEIRTISINMTVPKSRAPTDRERE